MLNEAVDLLDQVVHAAERAAADRALRNQGYPALHLVPPRGVGGRVIDVVARSLGQLGSHLGMFVSGVVVNHKVNLQFFWEDKRKLRRYRKRWKIERSIAWVQNFRRVYVRYDRILTVYLGFVYCACLLITLRHL